MSANVDERRQMWRTSWYMSTAKANECRRNMNSLLRLAGFRRRNMLGPLEQALARTLRSIRRPEGESKGSVPKGGAGRVNVRPPARRE